MKSVCYQNLHTGKAGELRVASELLLRGHQVYLTMVDSGIDIVLGNGKTIQVKSSMPRSNESHISPRYTFTFRSWKREPHRLDSVDFAILWAISHDTFFIIPTEILRGKITISVTPQRLHNSYNNRVNKYNRFAGQWDLLGKP